MSLVRINKDKMFNYNEISSHTCENVYYQVRMAIGKDAGKGNPGVSVGMYIFFSHCANSMGVPQRIKNRTAM